MVTLRNTSRDMAISVKAADGSSVQFGPGLTAEVEDKFLWNLPNGIVLVKPKSVPVVARATGTPVSE